MKNLISFVILIGLLFGNITVFADSYVLHTVQSGDTYWKISQEYNKDIIQLQETNNNTGDTLYEGSLIKIEPFAGGSTISIQIDGNIIDTDQDPYIENSRTFVPIRFISEALNIDEIIWDNSTQVVTLKDSDKTICLTIGSQTATINDTNIELDAPVSIYEDRTFVPVRFIAESFNCNVTWNTNDYIVSIQTLDYSEEDLYWLSRIVESEASAEPYDGKLAVANVVVNRKASSLFPDTIKEVIFDQAHGFQFTPVLNGTIYNTPSDESIKAAREALDGNNNIEDCIFFLNPDIAESFWIINNRTFYSSINQHDFYL